MNLYAVEQGPSDNHSTPGLIAVAGGVLRESIQEVIFDRLWKEKGEDGAHGSFQHALAVPAGT